MLASTIAAQRLKPIARRVAQIIQGLRSVQHQQLTPRLTLNCPETPRPYPVEKRFGFATRKRQDHRHPKTNFYILRKVDDVNAEKVEACRSPREKDQSRRRSSLTAVAVFTSSEAPDFNRLSSRVQGEREDKTAPTTKLAARPECWKAAVSGNPPS
jgi:hypothetical protein